MSESPVATSPPVTPPLSQQVFYLALPVLGEQLLVYCVGLVDTFLAGQLSTVATQAIGLAAYVSWLAALLFGLVAAGTTALVARSWGAGERDVGNRIFNQSLPLGVLLGLGCWVAFYWAAPLLAHLQSLEGEAAQIPVRYLRYEATAYVFTSLTLVCTAALRATGDMRTPLLILGLVNVLNIIMSWALVYGWGGMTPWGVDGIVGGTVFARVTGALVLLATLARPKGWSGLRIEPRQWLPDRAVIRRILRIGIPAAADGLLTWTGHFLFLMIISHLGTGAVRQATFAAHIVGIQVEALTYFPAMAWGTAAATLIGQALGAGNPQRALSAGHTAVRQCILLACGTGMLFFFGAPTIFQVMHTDPLVREIGVPALRFLGCFQVPLVICLVYLQSLRGAGETRAPVLFTIIGIFGVRVPLAYLCGPVLGGGLIGAWIGMCTDVALRALLAFLYYSRGTWVNRRI